MPDGSYDVESCLNAGPSLLVYALSAVPDGPYSWHLLLPYVLPYAPVPLIYDPPDTVYAGAGLLQYGATATFEHPPGSGPLTIAAVVLVWSQTPPVLFSSPIPVVPTSTPGPGWAVSVSLARTVIPPQEGE